jgi:hypothetical protein
MCHPYLVIQTPIFLQSGIAFDCGKNEIFNLFDLKISFIKQPVVKFSLDAD